MLLTIVHYYFLGSYIAILLFAVLMQFYSFYEYFTTLISAFYKARREQCSNVNRATWKIMISLAIFSWIGVAISILILCDYVIWQIENRKH